uniref:probable receptor-like protein kinase At2g39360 n=1 Tax=Erigeron canadensis TaxID=72917 RepID=UPI001CB8E8A5|nr:probable receptor-like protein kinase At2g39360 [Erigeron canadensis]
MSSIKEFQHLKISLKVLESATNNFSDANCLGRGGFGKVYKGEIVLSDVLTMVAIKRLDKSFGQGTVEFWKEIMMLSQYKHQYLVSLLGFCDEGGENLLVYEYLSNRSLDLYLDSVDLSWLQRLNICLGAAMGLQFLHEPLEGSQQRVLHRDIKSANILLDHEWRPKIADFGLSKLGPANQQFSFLYTYAVGTPGYYDPLYAHTGLLTKESDVYSFGVVLFEVLCGRPCVQNYDDIRKYLAALSRKSYEEKKMDTIILTGLQDNISRKCLERFSGIAYQCLHLDRGERPTMSQVVQELRFALYHQTIHQNKIQEVELKEIEVATNNFKSLIGENSYGERIYEGELSIFGIPTRVFIQRFREQSGLGHLLRLVDIRSKLPHPNHFSILGYCDEEREKIIVYENPKGVSLDQYIRHGSNATLTWLQRLEICAGVGHGLSYLHSKNVYLIRIQSAVIVYDDEQGVAKIVDLDKGAVINHAYNSPEYIKSGRDTIKTNVYSFGMVLFEVMCGRLCYEEVDGVILSAELIKDLYEQKKLYEFVDPAILRQQKQISSSYPMDKYSAIAYRCLLDDPKERPSMDDVVKVLQELIIDYRENRDNKDLDGSEKAAAEKIRTNMELLHVFGSVH